MKINRFTVSFDKWDMVFVKKYGFFKAASMARKFYKERKTPFISDTYQLARELGVSRKILFKIIRNLSEHYKAVKLFKKNGGMRFVFAPDAQLKHVQERILKRILNNIEISPYATAYVKGSTLKANAQPHINHKYLLKMDITDFFGSITYLQVISSAFNSKLYPKQVSAMLTSLCCLNDVLPQGTPTSPMLSNIVMKSFDDTMGKWCSEHNISYTRYCDDLTFSADIPLYTTYLKAKEMLEKWGFEVNKKKTKFVGSSSSQNVTGLTVNEKVSIPREYKRQLRQEIYYAIKFGIADSVIRSGKREYIKNGEVDKYRYFNHLRGKILYVLQIEPDNEWFDRAYDELEKVLK